MIAVMGSEGLQHKGSQGWRSTSAMLPRKERSELATRMLHVGDTHKKAFLDLLGEVIGLSKVVLPSVVIEFSNLTVAAEITVGSTSIPTVGNAIPRFFKGLLRQKDKSRTLTLLDNLSGTLRPGRLTLLLGPPGAGKSTFLKVLGHRLKENETLKVSGDIRYNGHTNEEFVVERTAAFVNQHDNHVANLTVYETLEFAHVCLSGLHGSSFDLPGALGQGRKVHHNEVQALQVPAVDGAKEIQLAVHDGVAGKLESSEVSVFNSHPSNKNGPVPSETSSSLLASNGGGPEGNRDDSKQEVLDEVEQLLSAAYGHGVRTDVVLQLMGLNHCRDTFVGDAFMRGISGGEKKRLSTAEMLVGQQHVFLLDEISTGLDSATLFSVISSLAAATHALGWTTVVSLLQPPPEVYSLFDDLILMSEGRFLYQGPVPDVLPFTRELGFVCPDRKDVPSYLLEITTPAGQVLFASDELKVQHGLPLGEALLVPEQSSHHIRSLGGSDKLLVPIEMWEQKFWQSTNGQRIAFELGNKFDRSRSHPTSLGRQQYALSPLEAVSFVLRRQMLLVARDRVLLKGRIIQVVVISVILGSLFWDLGHTPTDARTFFGASFMAVLFISMGGMPQLVMVMAQKSIWFKHRDNYFYPAYAQGSAMSLSQLPLSVIDAFLFSIITYLMVGFYRDAGYFFTYYLILLSCSLCLSALFRFMGVVAPNQIKANMFGGLVLLLLVLTSGFAIVRGDIPPWIIWSYYLSPFAYGIRSLLINEFTAPPWHTPSKARPGYTVGEAALLEFDFFIDRKWIWAGVGYLLGTFLLLSCATMVALKYIQPEVPSAQVPDEEQLRRAQEEAVRHKEEIHEVKTTKADVRAFGVDPENGQVLQGLPRVPSGFEISSSLDFHPITLVFVDIRYSVPNPRYQGKGLFSHNKSRSADGSKRRAVTQHPPLAVDPSIPGSAQMPPSMVSGEDAPETLELLKGITGYAEPGVLMALMGGSGAGKTTLMDVLCGRKTIGTIRGDIFVNGHPKCQNTWSRVVGYVEQMDVHTAAQTVQEALYFSARLRLPSKVSDKKVRTYVEEVMEIIDMLNIKYKLVGTPGVNGLSTEERKRLTIAVELVANPSVVFMDEPTSGLDARAAAIVMRAVRNIARSGRTVMVTIHQPSIEIFESFDSLLLIQRGGRTSYFGELGHQSQALIDFLRAVPGTPPVPQGFNPATWMLEVTGGSMATLVRANKEVVWPDVYQNSELAKRNRQYALELVEDNRQHHLPLELGSKYALPFPLQVQVLLSKYWGVYWRSPSYNFIRCMMTLIVGLIYGITYYRVAEVPEGEANFKFVQNSIGILFSSTNFLGMTNLMAVLPVVGGDRQVFYRERGASMYDPFAYGLAIALVEMPYLFVQGCLFTPVMYFMAGFRRTAEQFFYYFIMFLFSIMFYTIFGQFLVYVTPSQTLAQVVAAGLNFAFNVFNGFVITYPNMPTYWKWMNRITPTTYVLYGLAASQLGDVQQPLSFAGQVWSVSTFLKTMFGYEYHLRWWCILIVAAYVVFFRVTSILALKYWNFLRR